MGTKTGIEWTDATWNPIRGCSMAKGSETGGCLNCYAARLAARNLPEMRSPTTGEPFARILDSGPRWTGEVEVIEKRLYLPLDWKTPKRIFVNSMSDLFYETLLFRKIALVVGVIQEAHWHTFQVLTKRAENMRSFVVWWSKQTGRSLPDNLWLGVSIENQATADARITSLLRTPAAKRFISYEPALGPVDLKSIPRCMDDNPPSENDIASGNYDRVRHGAPGLDWVICGGESGPGARPMHPDWARLVRDQCEAAGVPFFFKQWGQHRPATRDEVDNQDCLNGRGVLVDFDDKCGYYCDERAGHVDHRQTLMIRVGKKAAVATLDRREHKAFPVEAEDYR